MVHSSRDDNKSRSPLDISEEPMVSPPVMRRFALFVDGLSRAVILPFGPSLIHRLVFGKTEFQSETWRRVGIHSAWVLSVYLVGRWFGYSISKNFTASKKLHVYVARLGGSAMSLHVFAYGAGLSSVFSLILIRLVASILSGTLCGITSGISLPEDGWAHELPYDLLSEDRAEANARRRQSYVDIAPAASKLYVTGFAVSILSGGLLFRPATKDSTFRALTGAYRYTWSPLFLVGLAVVVEIILRCLFSLARTTATEGLPMSTGKVRKAIVRIVAPSHDISKPLITLAINEEEEHDEAGTRGSIGTPSINRRRTLSFSTPGRSRVESYASIDDFFDCHSAFSEDFLDDDTGMAPPNEEAIAKYVNGKCLYDDGKPSFVNPGECIANIPQGYLDLYRGNEERARLAWDETQRWRRDMCVWKIHTLPNVWFSRIKEAYPHFVHGHSKDGYPIVYERPGQMNLKQLFRGGCDISDMIHHYTFFLEFIANVVCEEDEIRKKLGSKSWGIMVVLDVEGAGISSLSGDVLKYLKQAGDTNSSHYPLTMKRAFVINSPFWLSGAWSTVKGILPESVTVDILSERATPSSLREYIDDDQIPTEFGGSSPFTLGEHPHENRLKLLVEKSSECSSMNDPTDPSFASLPISTPSKSSARDSTVASPLAFPSKVLDKPLRRRMDSVERSGRFRAKSVGSLERKGRTWKGMENGIFSIISGMQFLLNVALGMMEAGLPLWLMSPSVVGGLGYSPVKSGVSMFFACAILLLMLRSGYSRAIFVLPGKASMRGLRIGVGVQMLVLSALAVWTNRTRPENRSASTTLMAAATFSLSFLSLSATLSYASSQVLHRTAAEAFVIFNSKRRGSRLASLFGQDRFHRMCSNGDASKLCGLAGEICGIFLVAPLWMFAIPVERSIPFNATLVIVVPVLFYFGVYTASFSLHINIHGEFAPHPTDSRRGFQRVIPFLLETISVAADDIASVLEEANWSQNPASGPHQGRSRAISDMSTGFEHMERGQDRPTGRKSK